MRTGLMLVVMAVLSLPGCAEFPSPLSPEPVVAQSLTNNPFAEIEITRVRRYPFGPFNVIQVEGETRGRAIHIQFKETGAGVLKLDSVEVDEKLVADKEMGRQIGQGIENMGYTEKNPFMAEVVNVLLGRPASPPRDALF